MTRASPNATTNATGDLGRSFTAVAIGMLLFGLAFLQSAEHLIAYLLVAAAVALSSALWIRAGCPGIPVLPVPAAFFFVYYAVPVLRYDGRVTYFAMSEVLSAAATVSLFLVATTLTWWLLLHRGNGNPRKNSSSIDSAFDLERLVLLGLGVGVAFHIVSYAGVAGLLGTAYPVARSIAVTVATLACFLLGYIRAQGVLRGEKWILAFAGLVANVMFACAGLYLNGAVALSSAAIFGYVISAKRVPWGALAIVAAVTTILQHGKHDMRDIYWPDRDSVGQPISLAQTPGMMAEWFEVGLENLIYGERNISAVDRASLVQMQLLVQRFTPAHIPYSEGETYALLPYVLVPRFLDPDKPSNQESLRLLNIRYGLRSADSDDGTSIGWGVIAEAFSNFGYVGVVGLGVLLGGFCGWIQRKSVGAPLLSLPTLSAIVVMLQLTNLEQDLGGLVSSTWQSLVAVFVLSVVLKQMSNRQSRFPRHA